MGAKTVLVFTWGSEAGMTSGAGSAEVVQRADGRWAAPTDAFAERQRSTRLFRSKDRARGLADWLCANQLDRTFLISVLPPDLTAEDKSDLVELSFSYNVRGLIEACLEDDVLAEVERHLLAASPDLARLAEALRQPATADGIALRQALRTYDDSSREVLEALVGSSY